MNKADVSFLESHSKDYQKLLNTPDINRAISSGIIDALEPARMLDIVQSVIPGYSANLQDHVSAYQVILEAYRLYRIHINSTE